MRVLSIWLCCCLGSSLFAQDSTKTIDETPSDRVMMRYNDANGIPKWQFNLNASFIEVLGWGDPTWALNSYLRYKVDEHIWGDLRVISPVFKSLDNYRLDAEVPSFTNVEWRPYVNLQLRGHFLLAEHEFTVQRVMKVGVHKYSNGFRFPIKAIAPVKQSLRFEVDYGIEYLQNSDYRYVLYPSGKRALLTDYPEDFDLYNFGSETTSIVFGFSLMSSYCTVFNYEGGTLGKWGMSRLYASVMRAVDAQMDLYEREQLVQGAGPPVKVERSIAGIELTEWGFRVGWERTSIPKSGMFTVRYGVDYSNHPSYFLGITRLNSYSQTYRMFLGFGLAQGVFRKL